MLLKKILCLSIFPIFLTSCFCTEEKVLMDFTFGQTEADVNAFMEQNGLTSIEQISCEDLCSDFDPALNLNDCDLTWEQEYLDSLAEETDPQRESPVDTGPTEPTVNAVSCYGTSYQSCD